VSVIKVVRSGVDQHITTITQVNAAIEAELQRMEAAFNDPGLTWEGAARTEGLGALGVLRSMVTNQVDTNRRVNRATQTGMDEIYAADRRASTRFT